MPLRFKLLLIHNHVKVLYKHIIYAGNIDMLNAVKSFTIDIL